MARQNLRQDRAGDVAAIHFEQQPFLVAGAVFAVRRPEVSKPRHSDQVAVIYRAERASLVRRLPRGRPVHPREGAVLMQLDPAVLFPSNRNTAEHFRRSLCVAARIRALPAEFLHFRVGRNQRRARGRQLGIEVATDPTEVGLQILPKRLLGGLADLTDPTILERAQNANQDKKNAQQQPRSVPVLLTHRVPTASVPSSSLRSCSRSRSTSWSTTEPARSRPTGSAETSAGA